MSLLSEAYEPCTIINRAIVPDGQGGVITTWTDGATINAAIVEDSSIEARIGMAQGVTSVYTITTSRTLNLQYHEVLRRESDGKIFRVTSDGDDKKTPKPATLDMRQVTAEEWSLPT